MLNPELPHRVSFIGPPAVASLALPDLDIELPTDITVADLERFQAALLAWEPTDRRTFEG
ncbi:hypothetical protein ACQPXH_27530 [Nocardia sp. CA-135953]|uniref:hypothetical protein n=1 Tax=Nocardia sp. CA-135953 TaxID=3239978 RepID=UPI003D96BF75